MKKASFHDDFEADIGDRRYSLMKHIGDYLDDLYIHNDHSDDIGMSAMEILMNLRNASEEFVFAMKGGSQEKQGSAPRELRVTWAPDVYEPTPTKLQDIVTRGAKQRKVPKKEKTVGKEGQKGKESSRGGGNKDSTRADGGKDKKKKQNHRVNGRGSKSYGYPDYIDADDD